MFSGLIAKMLFLLLMSLTSLDTLEKQNKLKHIYIVHDRISHEEYRRQETISKSK